MRFTKRLLITLVALLTAIGAQPIPAEKTEVVYSDAYSIYNGKGAGALHFHDSLNGISYIPNSSLYSLTTDGGASWRDGRQNELITPFRKMFITGRDTLVAVRDSNLIMHSYDGGETWLIANTLWPGEYMNNFFFFNSRHAVNFMSNTEYTVSSDRGSSWTAFQWPYRKVKPSIYYNNGYLFAIEVKQSPFPAGILYSTTNGFTWERINLPSTINDYTFIARGSDGFIIGTGNGIVYLVSEQGVILKRLTSPGAGYAGGYSYVNDSEIWCIDNNSNANLSGLTLYSVTDSTATYKQLTFSLGYADNIYATTWDRVVIGSGNTYSTSGLLAYHKHGFRDVLVERYEIPGSGDVASLFFVNEAKGFAGTSDGGIMKTTDGGLSWSGTNVPGMMPAVKGFAKRSESEFIAFCEAGTIMVSGDDGNNWVDAGSVFRGTIKRVVFAGRDTIFFCTADSLFMTTPSWQVITPVATGLSGGSYRDLDFYDAWHGSATYIYSAGGAGKAFVTTDRGKTWNTQSFDGWIYTYDPLNHGLIFKYSTRMSTWYEGSAGKFTDVTAVADQYDQTANGNMALTTGAKSVFFSFGERANYRHIYLENNTERRGIVAAGGNTFYMLSSGRRFWKFSRSTASPLPTTVLRTYPVDGSPFEYHNLKFKWDEPWTVTPITEYHFQLALGDTSNIVNNIRGIDSTHVIVSLNADSAVYFWRVRAANRYGWGSFNPWYTFRSSTIASQPTLFTTPLSGDLTAAIILPGGRLLVGDHYGWIARTNQLPGNWTTVASGTTYPILRFYYDPNNNLTFYLTNGNFLGYSTDKGVTWRRKEAPFGSTMITSLAPLKPNRIFGSGYYSCIYRTISRPDWWLSQYCGALYGDLRHINTLGSDKIAAVGDRGNILLSNDGGLNFRYIPQNPLEMFKRVSFAPDSTIVVLNQYGSRRVSTDMGETWTYETFALNTPVRDMITQNGACVVIDTLGSILFSTGPTSPWKFSKLPAGVSPMGVEISGDTILITARGNKLFFLNINAGSPVSVNDEPAIPREFTLSQNYPNPFNPETVIRYALPASGSAIAGYAKGVVYDILGREVATLIDGVTNAGAHEVKFNAAGLPSGIYIFRLQAGKYSSAIKMVVSK